MSGSTAIEEVDPAACVQLYRDGVNIPILRRRLETASEEWVEQFLEGGGLEAILASLKRFGGTVEEGVADSWLQCQCVEGIKELMSKKTGMAYMVTGERWKHMETLVLRECAGGNTNRCSYVYVIVLKWAAFCPNYLYQEYIRDKSVQPRIRTVNHIYQVD